MGAAGSARGRSTSSHDIFRQMGPDARGSGQADPELHRFLLFDTIETHSCRRKGRGRKEAFLVCFYLFYRQINRAGTVKICASSLRNSTRTAPAKKTSFKRLLTRDFDRVCQKLCLFLSFFQNSKRKNKTNKQTNQIDCGKGKKKVLGGAAAGASASSLIG